MNKLIPALLILAAALAVPYSLSTAHVLEAGDCLPEFCKSIINCYMLFWARKKKKEEAVEQLKVSRMIWVQAGGIPSTVQAARLLNAGQSSGELRLPWRSRMPSASTSGTHNRLTDCILPLFTLINEENAGQ